MKGHLLTDKEIEQFFKYLHERKRARTHRRNISVMRLPKGKKETGYRKEKMTSVPKMKNKTGYSK